MSQNLQNIAKFQKSQLENLVDFEKCCKTHILLQKSEPIQPKTSNILPKFCQKLATTLRIRARRAGARRAERGGAGPQLRGGDVRERRLAKFRQNVARLRLYRLRSLQENMRFAAFFKIYQIFKLNFLKSGKILQILPRNGLQNLLNFHDNC